MKQKVLITGASGFLGYHLIQAALAKGLEVLAAVRKNSDVAHLADLDLTYCYLDYEDEAAIAMQLRQHQVDFIIHAAGVTKAIGEKRYLEVNAGYTVTLAKGAAQLGSDFKKMVFISSLAAVGPLNDTDTIITETTTPHPVTAYGRSKLLAETSLAGIDIPTTILRPTAVYGPRDRDIFIMVKTVNNGFDPYIGNFLQQLSFVHARDVADVAVQALFLPHALGIFNITDGNTYDRYQLADITKQVLKKKAFRFHLPMPLVKSLAYFLETTNGWLKKPAVINREKLFELAAINWHCDISKAKQELHYAPAFDLQRGLENALEWYTKNKWL